MGTPEHFDIASGLIERIGRNASAGQVGAELEGLLNGIDAALCPILGRRGVAALMHRSLRVAGATFPWLPERNDGAPTTFDVAALKASVAEQAPGTALAGAAASIDAFCNLLVSLIGASLSERLLRPILVEFANAPTASGSAE